MQHLLRTLRTTRAKHSKDDKGFTLIELLVVVVILGVLIAVAIPLYLNYRKGVNDAVARSDLRNTTSVMELCNANNSGYPVQAPFFTYSSSAPIVPCEGQSVTLSSGTSMKYSSATGVSYIVVSMNTGGSPKYYCYNSSKSGSINAVAAASFDAATC